MKVRLGMTLKALRRSKGLSQAQLGAKLGISQQQMSRLEADVRRASLGALELWSAALDAYLTVEVRVSGGRALTDAKHAAIQNSLARKLRLDGWIVETEVSFNHFGDRGRIDVLAFHPSIRTMLVVEVKTRILDLQDLLGKLDVKKRIAPMLARDRAWTVAANVPAIVIGEDRTSRRRVADHSALFAPFRLRARAARAWLRRPSVPAPSGILLFEATAPSTSPSTRPFGGRKVEVSRLRQIGPGHASTE